jgi:osmotically-inducible protein OsmY
VALIRALTTEHEPMDDVTLAQEVRSEALGHCASTVLVDSANGVVTLRGVLQPDESRERIVHAVEQVHGVRRVEDLRHYDGESAPNKMAVLRLHQQAS